MLSKALLNLDQVANKLDPDFDPNAAIHDHVGEIMRRKMLQCASPANLLSAATDAKEFVENNATKTTISGSGQRSQTISIKGR
jgi:hypothetical protein